MSKKKNKKLVEDRVTILWDHYNKNGRLTCAGVLALTGQRAANLYASFQVHGIKAPPVWDTKAAIRGRQIDALWEKAAALGRDWLTSREAAEAAGVELKNVTGMERRYKGKIPEIRYTKQRTLTLVVLDTGGMVRQADFSPYTLKYYKKEDGPGPGQITFYIR